jgi:hypothetical protein
MCHVPAGPGDVQGLECSCTTSTCGAGMANAAAAVAAARRPIAAMITPASVSAGQNVLLSAAGSAAACNRTLAAFEWSVAAGPGVITGNPTPDSAVVVAPAAGSFTVRVTVRDDQGRADTADVLVTPTAATTGAPPSAGTTACLAGILPPSIDVVVSPSATGVQAGASLAFSATVSHTQNLQLECFAIPYRILDHSCFSFHRLSIYFRTGHSDRNPKSEFRNPKETGNLESENSKPCGILSASISHLNFPYSDLFRVSRFGIRI